MYDCYVLMYTWRVSDPPKKNTYISYTEFPNPMPAIRNKPIGAQNCVPADVHYVDEAVEPTKANAWRGGITMGFLTTNSSGKKSKIILSLWQKPLLGKYVFCFIKSNSKMTSLGLALMQNRPPRFTPYSENVGLLSVHMSVRPSHLPLIRDKCLPGRKSFIFVR